MRDFLMLIPFGGVAILAGCAPTAATLTPQTPEAKVTKMSETKTEQLKEPMPAEMSKAPQTYWPKQLDLPVVDTGGTLVRTLRLQPTVEIYEIKDGMGRIDETLDHWVDLSSFTATKPDVPLVQHEFTSRPPKVDLTRPDR